MVHYSSSGPNDFFFFFLWHHHYSNDEIYSFSWINYGNRVWFDSVYLNSNSLYIFPSFHFNSFDIYYQLRETIIGRTRCESHMTNNQFRRETQNRIKLFNWLFLRLSQASSVIEKSYLLFCGQYRWFPVDMVCNELDRLLLFFHLFVWCTVHDMEVPK